MRAGDAARDRYGHRIDITRQSHQETWQLIRKIDSDLLVAAIAKAKAP